MKIIFLLRAALKWLSTPSLPMLFQVETTECALACLAMISTYFGKSYSVAELREMHPGSLRGLNLKEVINISERIGLSLRVVRCEPSDLRHLRTPALLHWDFEHFVVLKRCGKRSIEIHDPGRGQLRMPLVDVGRRFTGVAVEATPQATFQAKTSQRPFTFWNLIESAGDLLPRLWQITYLSLLVELLSVMTPLLTKVVVDAGISHNDLGLIRIVLVGTLSVAITRAFVGFLRDYGVLQTGSSFNYQMVGGILDHLVRLPLSFFEKRQAGDLIDRYHAVGQVRDIMVGSLPLVILDGLFSVLSLGLLLYLWPTLAFISLATLAAYLILKFVFYPVMRSSVEQVVHARAHENGFVIETLKSIQTIKAAAREVDRKAVWFYRYVEFLNAESKLTRLTTLVNTLGIAIIGLDVAASLYIGAEAVMAGNKSLGALIAILMYKAIFSTKTVHLTNGLLEIRMLDAHLLRLSDVVLSKKESGWDSQASLVKDFKLSGAIKLVNLRYSYSPSIPAVINAASMSVQSNSFVAITGPSGCGKTTLMKLILGLYRPDDGEVLFDGISASALAPQAYRSQIGAVMQEDSLMTGSLAENISFFDPDADRPRIIECAKIACIHEDISSMSMQYGSRIGDMGAALSAGQRQRVLLARALYGRPAVLILDEGTANLDQTTELRLLDNLAQQKCTIIFFTHSQRVLDRADSVLRLSDGQLRLEREAALAIKKYAI